MQYTSAHGRDQLVPTQFVRVERLVEGSNPYGCAKNNKFETKLTLDEQIAQTKQELDAYKIANFASPDIILWLESIYESLCDYKKLVNDNAKNHIA